MDDAKVLSPFQLYFNYNHEGFLQCLSLEQISSEAGLDANESHLRLY